MLYGGKASLLSTVRILDQLFGGTRDKMRSLRRVADYTVKPTGVADNLFLLSGTSHSVYSS